MLEDKWTKLVRFLKKKNMENQENDPEIPKPDEESVVMNQPVEYVVSEQQAIQEIEEGIASSDLAIEENPPDQETEPVQENTDSCESVDQRLTAIEEELKRNNQLFESKCLYDATKEEMITRLHKELNGYKDDMFKKILKPVFMDMIVFADSMKSLVSCYEETPETDLILEKYQKLRKEFIKVESHICDLIYNYGIESFSSQPNDEFNPKTQQVRKDTRTDDSEKHKKIVESLSPGYIWDEQLLRRESVHVFKHEPEKTNI